MNTPGLSFLLQQLAYMAPLLLVYVAGVALGLVYLRRYPGPAILTIAGAGILLVSSVGQLVLQNYLMTARVAAGRSMEEYARMMSLLGIGLGFVRAAAFALLLLAVFMGRRPRPPAELHGYVPPLREGEPGNRFKRGG